MKRILFVDDEPRLLQGLQRMLRPQRHEWDMLFANGGEEALAVMAQTAVDVVVTDMRMPGMDGASLLQQVHARFPGAMRIVLSGQFDVEAGLRAVPVAHQFLTKPCDPDKLKAAIERSSQLTGAAVPDEATRRIVSAIGVLPSPPGVCAIAWRQSKSPKSPWRKSAGLSIRMLPLPPKYFSSSIPRSSVFRVKCRMSERP